MEPDKDELIRIVVVDGNRRICRALVRLLGPAEDIEVVATAGDAGVALTLVAQHKPTVVVVDVGSKYADGVEIIRTLRSQAPATRVVALSVYIIFYSQALGAGACRFLHKDCSRNELVAAIRLAEDGECQV